MLHTAHGNHVHIRHPYVSHYNVHVVEHIRQACNASAALQVCAERDMYEFGVLTGRSMKGYLKSLRKVHVPFRHYWGFDSFSGLPDEDASTERTHTSVKDWQPGSWSASEALRIKSWSTLEATLLRYLNDTRVSLVRGYYNESLTRTLAIDRRMRPALFVEIDCDLYVSSSAALDWMFASQLIVAGTILVYNDWAGGGSSGEARAHREACAKYNVTVTRLPSRMEMIFRVESVGDRVA